MGLYATTTTLDLLMAGVNMTAGSETLSIASTCINRAEARLNSVFARRYDVTSAYFQTTTSIPPLVREWAGMLAEGYMWKSLARGGAGKETMARGESLVKEVFADLKLLASYELDLVNTAGALIADMSDTSYRVLCNTSTYINTINEDDELNWAPDSDKIEDIGDTRE